MISGHFRSWRDVKQSEWPWPNFTPEEMACRGSGELLVVPVFMERLQRLRAAFGRPMPVTSGYRTPAHNARVSSTGTDGPHTTGRAVDIAVSGSDAFELVRLALACGFTGIGVRQRGAWNGRFIHLDDIESPGIRPRIWSY